jgi:hypothetical protein
MTTAERTRNATIKGSAFANLASKKREVQVNASPNLRDPANVMTMPTAEITSDVRGITSVNAKKDTAGPEKEKISARESHDENDATMTTTAIIRRNAYAFSKIAVVSDV